MKTLIKCHGGKAYLASWLLQHAPKHNRYIETFGGGAALLLRKPRADIEEYHDSNKALANLWTIVKQRPQELIKRLELQEYDERAFQEAKNLVQKIGEKPTEPDLDWAAAYYIQCRQSRGGLGTAFAWSDRSRGGQPGDLNAWQNAIKNIPAISQRIEDVEIFHSDSIGYLKWIAADQDTFIYCDPPYLPSTRTSKTSYGKYELSYEDHESLLYFLQRSKAKVMLSGYPNELYNQTLKGWRVIEKRIVNHASQAKVKETKVEQIWLNY